MWERDLEIKHLVALQAVAAERSFGRAADRLGFTQSAISQQIAALERVVGEPVFDRPGGPRPVELTPAGQVLLDHAEAVFRQLHQAEDEVAPLCAPATAAASSSARSRASRSRCYRRSSAALKAERPLLDIRLFEADDLDILGDRIVEGQLDLAFMVGTSLDERFTSIHLMDDPYLLDLCPHRRVGAPRRADGRPRRRAARRRVLLLLPGRRRPRPAGRRRRAELRVPHQRQRRRAGDGARRRRRGRPPGPGGRHRRSRGRRRSSSTRPSRRGGSRSSAAPGGPCRRRPTASWSWRSRCARSWPAAPGRPWSPARSHRRRRGRWPSSTRRFSACRLRRQTRRGRAARRRPRRPGRRATTGSGGPRPTRTACRRARSGAA